MPYIVDDQLRAPVAVNAYFWALVEGRTNVITETSVSPTITQGGPVQITTGGKAQGLVLAAGDTTVLTNSLYSFAGFSDSADTTGDATIRITVPKLFRRW